MKEKFFLKDHLFNEFKVRYLAQLLTVAYPVFNEKAFVQEVVVKFPELELKARIAWMAEVLQRHLPPDFNEAVKIIIESLPPPLDATKTDDDFGNFIFAPLGEYVVKNGITQKHLKLSLCTLREITMRFSMEDAMRAFLNNFPDETLAMYDEWAVDKNYHVRRLVSESTRPSLPWSQKINVDYKLPIKYLDILHADTTRYVTRSVANHLNDISKKDPALVVSTLKRWRKEKRQSPAELEWMTKHALRTLVKRGDISALGLLGFTAHTPVVVSNLILPKKVSRGEKFEFSFYVQSEETQNLLVDYVIDFVKANGATKPKVFKLNKLILEGGLVMQLSKKHHLKADATTFTLNSGTHTLSIQINGQLVAGKSFEVH